MSRADEPVLPVTVTSSPSPSSAGRFSVIRNLVLRRAVIHGMWTYYNPLRQLTTLFTLGEEEEDVMRPGSGLNFVIASLISFTAIKSQGEIGFPFRTYPHASMLDVTSLLLYGFFSAAQRAASAQTPPSVYAGIARLGRKVSLYILVGALAYGLYF